MKYFTLLVAMFSIGTYAQVGIGTTTPNAAIDVTSTNDGALLPRVALTITTSALPLTAPTTSELVYNTATVADVTPGYYYWDGVKWVRLQSGSVSNDWALLGNAGTNPATNFLGTTDTQDLVFRTNNTERFRNFQATGNTSFGSNSDAKDAKVNVFSSSTTSGINTTLDNPGGLSNQALRVENLSAYSGSSKRGILNYISEHGTPTTRVAIENQMTTNTNNATSNMFLFNNYFPSATVSSSTTFVFNSISPAPAQDFNATVSGVYNAFNIRSTSTGVLYGIQNDIRTGSANKAGIYNSLSNDNTATGGGGAYKTYGVSNLLIGNGNQEVYGVLNSLHNSGTGNHYGVFNTSDSIRPDGVTNTTNTTNANFYGTYNDLKNTGSGTHYATYSSLTGTGTGSKYGNFITIPTTAGGSNYGIYSDAIDTTNDFSGYFLGRVSIGTTTANNYIMPFSRGTNGQIMVTDGVGNVNWANVSSTISSLAWMTTGNAGTNPATNFLGTTDAQDLVIRTNNIERFRNFQATGNTSFGSNSDANLARVNILGNDANTTSGAYISQSNPAAATTITYGARISNSTVATSANQIGLDISNTATTTTGSTYSAFLQNNSTGAGSKFGIRNELTATGTGTFRAAISNRILISSNAATNYGVYNRLQPELVSTTPPAGSTMYGIFNEGLNAGSVVASNMYGVYNNFTFSPTSTGIQYGVYNDIVTTSNTRYGTYNRLLSNNTATGTGTGLNAYGSYNEMSGNGNQTIHGIYNMLSNTGTGDKYGSYTTSGATANNAIYYGSYIGLQNTGTGNKYGNYITIPTTAGGTHYGIYSDVLSGTGYSGYFLGRFSIGTAAGNEYIMPASRGTAGQIMVTDGAGNVSWGNASNSNAWSTFGNTGTNVATNFIGTSDNNALVIRTNNTERMRFLTSNHVLINTTTNDATYGSDNIFEVLATGASEDAVNGISTNAGYGVHGVSTTGNGVGVFGTNNAIGSGVYGANNGGSTGGAGVTASTASDTAPALRGFNTSVVGGTGLIATGANQPGAYFALSGSSSIGFDFGATGISADPTDGVGVAGLGNNNGTIITTGVGAGVAGTANQIGVIGQASNTTGVREGGFFRISNATVVTTDDPIASLAGDNGTDTYGGYFDSKQNASTYAYVGLRSGGTNYKILGGGSVSTIVKDENNKGRILFAPETPEIIFQDYGTGKLVNGEAIINIDPVLAKNIFVDEKHPLKVFIQLEGDCKGVFVTNKSANGFTVKELQGGTSNTSFSWQIVATRANTIENGEVVSKHVDVRFPDAPGPISRNEVKSTAKKYKDLDKIKQDN